MWLDYNHIHQMSKIEDDVCQQIQDRAKVGLNKYGTTMERTDLSTMEWLEHAKQEAMDLVIYLERIIQDMRKKEE